VDYDAVIYGSEEVPCVPALHIHYTFCILQEQLENQRGSSDTGGYAIALKFSMQKITSRGDVFWAASDVGWVVGHSFIVYGPLINRNSSIILKGNL
jgi:propionyl-CoA synthetase